jgi:hypothetical protein
MPLLDCLPWEDKGITQHSIAQQITKAVGTEMSVQTSSGASRAGTACSELEAEQTDVWVTWESNSTPEGVYDLRFSRQ